MIHALVRMHTVNRVCSPLSSSIKTLIMYPLRLSKGGEGEEDQVSVSYSFICIDRFKDGNLLKQVSDFNSNLGILNSIYGF